MKTAVWLYLFLFVAFFDLHAQYPILTPFAISLGAAPSFIGLMMGLYSITHLPGNLIAGYGVDRYGSRLFIVFSLLTAGAVLIVQSHVTNPWQLLVLRSVSGFVLAFLSPACMTLLARITTDRVRQGKLMAGNGFIHTLASVVSPAAGAYLVAQIGFTAAFYALGWILIATAVCALFFIRDIAPATADASASSAAPAESASDPAAKPSDSGGKLRREAGIPWTVFLLPVATSCAQGILSFELPLMGQTPDAMMTTGLLFSIVSLGALLTLSMLFLNRLSPYYRTLWGTLLLAVCYYTIAADFPVPLMAVLFIIGMGKGVIFPALSSLLIELSGGKRYGRTFSALSIAFSVGAFIGPMLAGHLREQISSYFIAFAVLMLAAAILPLCVGRSISARTHFS